MKVDLYERQREGYTEPEEETCRFGHICSSDCQKNVECPCQNEHCCALTENCEGKEYCDDHYESKRQDNEI